MDERKIIQRGFFKSGHIRSSRDASVLLFRLHVFTCSFGPLSFEVGKDRVSKLFIFVLWWSACLFYVRPASCYYFLFIYICFHRLTVQISFRLYSKTVRLFSVGVSASFVHVQSEADGGRLAHLSLLPSALGGK